jgi:hypothetical protein
MWAVVKVYKDWTAKVKTGDLNRWLPRTAGAPSAAERAGQAHQAALHGADEGAPADLRDDRLARRPGTGRLQALPDQRYP